MKDLKESLKSNRKLFIVSPFLTSSYPLDIYDNVDIKNRKGVILESISINSLLMRFYEIPRVKAYGIIHAYIWDNDSQKIERYIENLPGDERRHLLERREVSLLYDQMRDINSKLLKIDIKEEQ